MFYVKDNNKLASLKKRSINTERRRFLETLSKASVSTALLKMSPILAGAFSSQYALAQGGPNKRCAFMYLPNGAPNGMWLPGSQTNMNLSTAAYADVADVTQFREVNMGQGGHGTTFRSMGSYEYQAQNTIDYYVAENFPLANFKLVRAGVQAAGQEYFTREAGQQAAHIDGPERTFQALFNGSPAPISGDNTYQDVFAMTQKALNSVRSKLGVEERQRLESHLASVEEIERRVANAATAPQDQGEACTSPEVFDGANGNIIDEGKMSCDIVVAAMACGLTNVATIQLSNDQAEWFHGGRVDGIQDTLSHHNVSHSGNEMNTGLMVRLLSEVPAYFIGRLKEVTGPDGAPLIDSTLFVQVSDMGDGNHGLSSAPFLMASNLPGFGGFAATGGGNHKSFMEQVPNVLNLPATLES